MPTAPRKLWLSLGCWCSSFLSCIAGVVIWAVALIATLIAFNLTAPEVLRRNGLQYFGEDEIRGFYWRDIESVMGLANLLIILLFLCVLMTAAVAVVSNLLFRLTRARHE
jgi:hypothetical protein